MLLLLFIVCSPLPFGSNWNISFILSISKSKRRMIIGIGPVLVQSAAVDGQNGFSRSSVLWHAHFPAPPPPRRRCKHAYMRLVLSSQSHHASRTKYALASCIIIPTLVYWALGWIVSDPHQTRLNSSYSYLIRWMSSRCIYSFSILKCW